MAMYIDHICIQGRNIYEIAHRLRMETGLGYYDGGFFGQGIANKIFPLGGGSFIEVESYVDPFEAMKATGAAKVALDKMEKGDFFTGLCLGVRTMEELEAIAKAKDYKIGPPATRIRPDGSEVHFLQAPSASTCWPAGIPNWYVYPDYIKHPSGQPVGPGPNLVKPNGIAWLEMGGTEAEMEKWLGVSPSVVKMRFNGKTPGLYAVAVSTDKGEIVIRRKSTTEV